MPEVKAQGQPAQLEVIEFSNGCFFSLGPDFWSDLEKEQSAVEEAKARFRQHVELSRVLHTMSTSWQRTRDGKKTRPDWYMVDQTGWIAIPKELLRDGEEAPPSIHVVPWDEIATAACPTCGQSGFVLRATWQVAGHVTFDEWASERAVLCTRCAELKTLSTNSWDN